MVSDEIASGMADERTVLSERIATSNKELNDLVTERNVLASDAR